MRYPRSEIKQVQEASDHVPVSILWKYQKEAATLAFSHAEHLKDCQDCVAILILCRACRSLPDVEMKLKQKLGSS